MYPDQTQPSVSEVRASVSGELLGLDDALCVANSESSVQGATMSLVRSKLGFSSILDSLSSALWRCSRVRV